MGAGAGVELAVGAGVVLAASVVEDGGEGCRQPVMTHKAAAQIGSALYRGNRGFMSVIPFEKKWSDLNGSSALCTRNRCQAATGYSDRHRPCPCAWAQVRKKPMSESVQLFIPGGVQVDEGT